MSYYNSPFRLIDDLFQIPTLGADVYVVSDSQYKQYRQKQAEDEIAVLEKRLAAYEKTADGLRQTIAELKQEHGLLPEASEE